MGYRSEVVIAIDNRYKNYQLICPNVGYTFLEKLSDEKIQREDYVIYLFSSIKWYDVYKDISNVHKYLIELKEQNIDYGFLRLGEEVGDIEEEGNPGNYDLWVSQQINY